MGIFFSQKGITLIELLIVITIMAVLLAMATMGFNSMQRNAHVDRQAKQLYADLMKARSDALFRKSPRSVKLASATELAVYPNSDCSGDPIFRRTFPSANAVQSNNSDPVAFDATGVANAVGKAYCVGPADNGAGVDSVVISTTSIMMGKLTGGACTSANIIAK